MMSTVEHGGWNFLLCREPIYESWLERSRSLSSNPGPVTLKLKENVYATGPEHLKQFRPIRGSGSWLRMEKQPAYPGLPEMSAAKFLLLEIRKEMEASLTGYPNWSCYTVPTQKQARFVQGERSLVDE